MKACVPSATYRLQLNSTFGLRDAAARIPYLASLGVSTLFCSPVLQARAGSMHGYDTVDPLKIGDELGGAAAWDFMMHAAQRHGLNVLLDIVPNHMAASVENPWWRDVLENGRISPYATVFDIDWESSQSRLRNRVVLPLLTAPVKDVIDNGGLAVHLVASGLVLRYGELELPLDVRSYHVVLAPLLNIPASQVPEPFGRLIRSLVGLLKVTELPGCDPELYYELRRHLKGKLMECIQSGQATAAQDVPIEEMVGDACRRLAAHDMRRLLREQNFVLEYWKTGRGILNYRRFFDITELAGVRVEDEQVFELTHGLLGDLARSGAFCGFRVDHVDGLHRPLQYLKRLHTIAVSSTADGVSRRPYVVVEKILSGHEVLPQAWPVHGTTGYDFLNEVIGLFVEPSGLAALQRHHRAITRSRSTREKLTYDNKRCVLAQSFQPELWRLASILLPVAQWLYPAAQLTGRNLVAALVDVTAALPVYRTYYAGAGELSATDRRYIESAVEKAAAQPSAATHAPAREVLRRALTLDLPARAPAKVRSATREHLLRWQQLSGAAMAKGFEDTTLYQDSVLLALNNVGSRHSLGATTLDHFHAWNHVRLRDWPHTMNCTATHDAKRGEDMRARIAVLSELPDDWRTAVDRWFTLLRASDLTTRLEQQVDSATHLFLLQTIIGAWPEGGRPGEYAERLSGYMTKVAREAKVLSSWLEPDEDYERALADLCSYIVTGAGVQPFRDCFGDLIKSVRFHGLVNSLAQVLLKATSPGIPDFYQGTELLELSLVDPDNRRPVDYESRESILSQVLSPRRERLSLVTELTGNWPDARAKLYTIARALRFRLAHRDLFAKGRYTPLHSDGVRNNHVCAFTRNHKGDCVLVVVPLKSRILAGNLRLPLGGDAWGDEAVVLPPGSPRTFENIFTGETVSAKDGRLLVADAFPSFPVALLVGV